MNNDIKNIMAQKMNIPKTRTSNSMPSFNTPTDMKRTLGPQHASPIKDDFSSLKDAAAAVNRIRISAQQELELIRNTRADALKYQQESAAKARSEAHQLILHARLQTQREIEELIRQASEEIQKVLADIRVIRITAQEELAAQRKFTDAAKLSSMSLSIQEDMEKPDKKKKKPLDVVNS
jgi:SepF-like predicted cell division protein (DUF552 family)